jgi:hypothetical protein
MKLLLLIIFFTPLLSVKAQESVNYTSIECAPSDCKAKVVNGIELIDSIFLRNPNLFQIVYYCPSSIDRSYQIVYCYFEDTSNVVYFNNLSINSLTVHSAEKLTIDHSLFGRGFFILSDQPASNIQSGLFLRNPFGEEIGLFAYTDILSDYLSKSNSVIGNSEFWIEFFKSVKKLASENKCDKIKFRKKK